MMHATYEQSKPWNDKWNRPIERVIGENAASAEMPIARNCLREYLAQNHQPTEFNPKLAGSAEYSDPRYEVIIGKTTVYEGSKKKLIDPEQRKELRRQFRQAA